MIDDASRIFRLECDDVPFSYKVPRGWLGTQTWAYANILVTGKFGTFLSVEFISGTVLTIWSHLEFINSCDLRATGYTTKVRCR